MKKIGFSCYVMFAALSACVPAAGQNYPLQPIRAVVGYAAGGGADGMIRAISNELSEALGQPVVIDNRPGGGTVIATQIVANSKPDGYTIYVADPAIYFNPFLLAKVPYDAVRDFAPIGPVSLSSTSMLVVHPSFPAKTLKDLVALARTQPGKLNYASGGNGTLPHVLTEMMKSVAQINLVHVPYKSTGLAIYAATSGEVPIAAGGLFAVKGLAESGKLRPLAIASTKRSPLMPQVPTFAEAGWPQIDGASYRGLLAPAGTPRDIIAKLNAATNKVLQIPAVRTRFTDTGSEVLPGTPEEYGRIIRAELEKWGRVIRAAGIRVE
ncbi:MAG TPA: tripartite tricarboxylate transporter substrate binding protein [Burkholderiales bacterium]|nr:tripartite tricarboxylate transporter substrate binding protein [Burkholderiales bacterium]